MTRRYKILDGALNYLKFGDTASDVTLPANTPLRSFQEWRNNERKITYERTEQSLPGSIDEVSLNPFGLPVDVANQYVVPVSNRAKVFGLGDSVLAAGNTDKDVPEGAIRTRGFVPAKAYVSVPFNDPRPGDPTSKLTGLKYARSNTRSFTLPYGASTANPRESEVRAAIIAVVAQDNIQNSVRFTSEKL